jgi:hypothetical protein
VWAACLSVVVSTVDPTYARADLDRRRPCGRYGWSVTAIFHRAGGTWRRALYASSYGCPVRVLPQAVQRELLVCP